MLELTLLAVGCLFGLWFICRCLAWFVCWIVKHTSNVELHIGKVGFFTLGHVCVTLNNGVAVEIERLWLSSSFISSDIRKPVAICVNDVRIQLDLPGHSSMSGRSPPNLGERHGLLSILSYIQFLGLVLDNVHVILVRGLLSGSMTNLTIQEVGIDWTIDCTRDNTCLDLLLKVDNFSARMFCSPPQDGATCIAEVMLSHTMYLRVDTNTANIQVARFTVEKPHVLITEGLLHQVQKRQHKDSAQSQGHTTLQECLKDCAFHIRTVYMNSLDPNGMWQLGNPQFRTGSTALPTLTAQSVKTLENSQFLPEEVYVQLENSEFVLLKESSQRRLALNLRDVSVHFNKPPPEGAMVQPMVLLTVKDVVCGSAQVKVASLAELKTTVRVDDSSVNIASKIQGGFLSYHHEELQYWLAVISSHPAPMHPPPVVSRSSQLGSHDVSVLAVILGQRALSMIIEIEQGTLTIATATCAGLKGAVDEAKIMFSFKVNHRGEGDDVRAEMEVMGLYCQMIEGATSPDNFTSKHHHWGNVLYLGIVIAKMRRLSNDVTLDSMLDSVQVEWSSSLASIISQFLHAVSRGRPSCISTPECTITEGTSGANLWGLVVSRINVQCSSINAYICNDLKVGTMLRADSLVCHQRAGETALKCTGTKLVYFRQTEATQAVVRSHDIHDYCGHLKHLDVIHTVSSRKVSVDICEEVYLVWTTALHMCLYNGVQDALDLGHKLQGVRDGSVPCRMPPGGGKPTRTPHSHYVVNVRANCMVALQLSTQHRVSFSMPELKAELKGPKTSVSIPQASISCDDHEIFTFENTLISSLHHSPRIQQDREGFSVLDLPTNRAWGITFDRISVVFPHQYVIAECFEETVNLNKWRKLVHKVVKAPFTVDSPLPPDLVIKVQSVTVQVSDDPFEVRLGDNYELLSDERVENEKRQHAMDKRIQELRKKYGLLPASKIGELYTSLSRKASEVYIQRSRQLYVASPRRTKLFTWMMTDVEITALADTSLHGKDNVVKHMRSIDKDSPYPEEGLEFITLWCRMVNVSAEKLLFQLRDFPMPLLEIKALHLWGRLIGAEQESAVRARRSGVVQVAEPWGNMTVVRFMPSLKFYHDFSCDVTTFNMAYSPCWEPTFAQYNLAQNLINRPSIDPSPLLPFWDKARLLLHGRLTMSVAKMHWIYHVSLDPYNTTELMDWTWSKLILDWTNAKWVLRGDLDIYARTASKYDDCNLLHLPNLRFCIRLDWGCRGDANDHHSVMQCAPDKLPEYSHQDHDSFRAFRSTHLNMSVSFETKEGRDPSDLPRCLFYASTLRWMDKIKMCFARVSRPIHRGKLFNFTTPRKPQLSRHLKDTELSVSLHGFQVQYAVSFARQHGLEMKGGVLSLGVGAHLELLPLEDHLIHRLQADWSVRHFSVQLEHTTIWLVSSNSDGEEGVSLRGPVSKNYFLSVEKVMYQRDDPLGTPEPQSPGDVEEKTVHKVQILELKGEWSPSNRNVAFSLYDGYSKAQTLKKNLSSDALKGFKVDSSQTPTKNRSMSMTSPRSLSVVTSPSPMSKIQAGPAYCMLQKLVSEADSRFVAVHEEVSGGSVEVEQLHGIQACQTDDVLKRNWLIELYNSQVMLRGKETAGYVIVSAGKASILSREHQPVWRQRQPRSKTTWVGCVEFMQYYATVDPSAATSEDKVLWLTKENIEYVEDHCDGAGLVGMPEMIGSGQSVGGVVSDTLAEEGETLIQLQRIISRCKCQFFYAHFGEADCETYPEVPPPPADDSDMMKQEEGVNSFTLVHHDLNICTNSLQYAMILDIINNLLLHVEPRKKEANEKLQKMRFQLALSSGEDQKKPILHRQNMLRQLLSNMRRLERELYMVHKALEDEPSNEELLEQSHDLEIQLYDLKIQTMALSQELAIMISCFKENQLQVKAQRKAAKESKTLGAVVRRNEVCFKHAEWRMTEADGQIGIADLVLRNFLYSKLNRSDDSGAHQLELGWVKVTNLLTNSLYKDVLVPQDRGHSNRQMALRILCKFKAPVGGIAVQEHFEVNVVPISIQLTYRFYKTVMGFFFPGSNIDPDDTQSEEGDGEAISPTPVVPPKSRKKTSIKQKVMLRTNSDDIDKMKERAEQNNMFLYCKIPEVPMRLSYKGEKDKNIEDAYDLSLLLPTLEYHNETWTWLDFLLAVKKDSKRILIQQAIKQKLHVRSRGGATEEPKSEGQQEEDKVKMLLGAKLLSGGEKPHSKKSLFGKLNTK